MDIWRDHPDQCDLCGSSTEIFTDETITDGHGRDGDEMRCTDQDCGAIGLWTVYDDGEAYSSWDEFGCTGEDE